ncbi:MAG: DNA repair and recombination protein RadB [Nanoarchaeota archaeon]
MIEDTREKISAGSYDLNKWLHGGYESGIITAIFGASGTGKTNFCLLAAVSQAKKGNKVIYIDSEGGFSVERIKQLSGDSYEEVLKNIFLLKPTSFNEQKDAFKQLLRHIKDQASLIVVDGMTMLYRLDFAEAREKGIEALQDINAELARQMRILAEIARKQELPVIVTNQVYSWNDGVRMVAGDVMKYWSKCLIELVNDNGRRSAFLRKHRSLPEKRLDFVITEDGVKKKGWL